MGTSDTQGSKSTSKSKGYPGSEAQYAEFPNGKQLVLSTWQGIHKGGTIFVVMNPKECTNFEHLLKIGKVWTIAGKTWRILGVERFAHAPPWTTNEPIGLECVPCSKSWKLETCSS